jgi:hypothetical protein
MVRIHPDSKAVVESSVTVGGMNSELVKGQIERLNREPMTFLEELLTARMNRSRLRPNELRVPKILEWLEVNIFLSKDASSPLILWG